MLGDSLGSVKREHESTGESYWLGKKFYYMYDKGDVIRIKGIPVKTIDLHGNDIQVVDRSLYERVYYTHRKGVDEPITASFATLVKSVFGKVGISSMQMTRTITPKMQYREYH